MVMFLDELLDERRATLASRLGISVVCEVDEQYRVMNPNAHWV